MTGSVSLPRATARARRVRIDAGPDVVLEGEWSVPDDANGMVLFAHVHDTRWHLPRNEAVARALRHTPTGMLSFDLLTPEEGAEEGQTSDRRFDIALLSERFYRAAQWVARQPRAEHLGLAFLASSIGAAAALTAAARLGPVLDAVVARSGRTDLAGPALSEVESPTLFIVGERDEVLCRLNTASFAHLRCEKELAVVPRATHLFEEPGALEEAARLAAGWFEKHLKPR